MDRFEYQGKTYVAKDNFGKASCDGCAFNEMGITCPGIRVKEASCFQDERQDKRMILWVEMGGSDE